MSARLEPRRFDAEDRRTLRVAGSLLVAGGLLWQPLLAVEHLAGGLLEALCVQGEHLDRGGDGVPLTVTIDGPEAIAVVTDGGAVFGSSVAAQVLDHLAHPGPPPKPAFPELTPRERQILDLVAAGLSNASIATHLGMSVKTVGNHLSNIFTKLRVSRRSEAIVIARDAGLGQRHREP